MHYSAKQLIRKTRDDYNQIARHFAATRTEPWGELEQCKSFVQNGQSVLDWGCGSGRLLSVFAGKKIKYVGLDQSRELIWIARRTYAGEIKNGRAQFFCTGSRAKYFPPRTFAAAFLIASFHHLPTPRSRLALLRHLFQELKPGGILFLTVWNLESKWAEAKKSAWKEIALNDYLIPWKNAVGNVECERYYHHFSEAEITKLLEAAGFIVESVCFTTGTSVLDKKNGRNLVIVARRFAGK